MAFPFSVQLLLGRRGVRLSREAVRCRPNSGPCLVYGARLLQTGVERNEIVPEAVGYQPGDAREGTAAAMPAGSQSDCQRQTMVRLSGECSNQLFDILAEWAEILKTTSLGRRTNDNIPPKPAQTRAKKKR